MLSNVANVSSGDQGGRSGLHHAAHLGHYEMVELLLDKGHVPIGKFIIFEVYFLSAKYVISCAPKRLWGGCYYVHCTAFFLIFLHDNTPIAFAFE